MEIHTIKTEEDYENALSVIDMLLSARSGSEEAECLELISILVEDFLTKQAQKAYSFME